MWETSYSRRAKETRSDAAPRGSERLRRSSRLTVLLNDGSEKRLTRTRRFCRVGDAGRTMGELRYMGVQPCMSFDRLLKDPELDGVTIATPLFTRGAN